VQPWQCHHHFSVQSPGFLSRAFSSAINTLLYAPDGQTLLTSSEDWDNPIQLWNLETFGSLLWGASGDPVQLWNLLNGQPSQPIGNWILGRFSRLALSNDGKILAIGGTIIELWNLETRERLGELGSLFGHRDMSALAISPDNTTLATTSLGESPFNFRDYSIHLWDLTTSHSPQGGDAENNSSYEPPREGSFPHRTAKMVLKGHTPPKAAPSPSPMLKVIQPPSSNTAPKFERSPSALIATTLPAAMPKAKFD